MGGPDAGDHFLWSRWPARAFATPRENIGVVTIQLMAVRGVAYWQHCGGLGSETAPDPTRNVAKSWLLQASKLDTETTPIASRGSPQAMHRTCITSLRTAHWQCISGSAPKSTQSARRFSSDCLISVQVVPSSSGRKWVQSNSPNLSSIKHVIPHSSTTPSVAELHTSGFEDAGGRASALVKRFLTLVHLFSSSSLHPLPATRHVTATHSKLSRHTCSGYRSHDTSRKLPR
jgi:hypothetical protein